MMQETMIKRGATTDAHSNIKTLAQAAKDAKASLAAEPTPSAEALDKLAKLSEGDSPKKLYIKTFGCQMNEYDSDKMIDVLHASQGME